MDQPELLALTSGATGTLRPARLLQGGLAILLGAVELDVLGQRHSCLKLDSSYRHGRPLWFMRTSFGGNGLLTELAT
jgi:hypothetical protein